jgi:8-oxo-dGTP pyrophosphatase MutT (NUDIX family)
MAPRLKSLPIAVSALIRRADGRFLLALRALDIPGGGRWCPIAGRPQPGEPWVDAIKREVQEEVGLNITVGAERCRGLTSDATYELVYFDAQPQNGSRPDELTLDPEEVMDAGWFSPEEVTLLHDTFAATRELFQRICDEGKRC